jgi:hypothetical protein
MPKNGDICLVETPTYLVGAAGDPLTSGQLVRFAALHNLPLVLFCRPSGWRNRLEQIIAERDVSLPCPFFEVLFCATTVFYLSLISNMAMLAVLERGADDRNWAAKPSSAVPEEPNIKLLIA